MRLHILGICGTFMGGLAAIARELGHEVEGSDANVYPPMSTQLEALGIKLRPGYRAEHLQPAPDLILVGNALSRGNPAVEYMLDARLPYVSGPHWLGEQVLAHREVLAVAGTHGKTTTTSLLAWLLECAGRSPGFLIGGAPANFPTSARLGKNWGHKNWGQSRLSQRLHRHLAPSPPEKVDSDPSFPEKVDSDPSFPESRVPALDPQAPSPGSRSPFVIEADEYDTAFFDKRSKFVHYRPRIAVLNNLEYDHADIFPDVAAIQRQFHHLVRTVPGNGRLIVNAEDARLAEVLAMGCWTPVETFGIGRGDWQGEVLDADGSHFRVAHAGRVIGEAHWPLMGRHNVMNALAALAAAHAAGCDIASLLPALAGFAGARRRMETVAEVDGIHVYDDFAHHPTAIATTLAGLRAHVGKARIVVAIEPRSNSMRLGAHARALAPSLAAADEVVFLKRPELAWDAALVMAPLGPHGRAVGTVDALLATLCQDVRAGDHVVFMSNGGFEDAPHRFVALLREGRAPS